MPLLKEGDVIEIVEGMNVYADIPEHFAYSNKKGSFKLCRHEAKVWGELSYLAGKYIVTKTTEDGGGTGHGPGDIYPDGHHVFCSKHNKPSDKVDFYQTGSFTCMIEDIEPVGKAKLSWSLE